VFILILVLSSPVVILLTHVFFQRFVFKQLYVPVSRQAALLNIAGILLLFYLFLTVLFSWSEPWLQIVINTLYVFIATSCSFYAYFHFFNMSETARRIRILIGIYEYQIKNDTNAFEENTRYFNDNIIEQRIKRLIDMRVLSLNNELIVVESKVFLIVAEIIGYLRWLFYGNKK